MNNPLKIFHALAQKTALDLGDAIPAIGLSAATMHAVFHFVTERAGESNSLTLRVFAITALAPAIFHNIFSKTKFKAANSSLSILGLFICGPLFFSLSIVLELSQAHPDQSVIIHRQFEYFASFALILFFLSDVIVVVIAAILCASFAYIYSSSFLYIEETILLDIFAPVSSLWIFLLLLVAYVFRQRANARLDGMAALSAVGSNVAHELRTPLASIKNYTRSVQKEATKLTHPNRIQELSNKISREVESANTIVDMLLISAGTADRKQLQLDELYVGEIIEKAVKGFPYNNDLEKDAVSTSIESDFKIYAPELQLTHVFFNLLKNGLRYAQTRGKSATLSIQLDKNSRTLTFFDNGTGISKANLRKIFDRFYTTEKYGQGTGIGLSFCKMTMESIGGSIECESVLGEYTKFTLKFP
jgi:signal transduction histidine kinase